MRLESLSVCYCSACTKYKSERQRLQNFLPVRKLPTQVGYDGVRNMEPKFTCWGIFKICFKKYIFYILSFTPPLAFGFST
jgi:hypothetical protein